MRKIPLLVVGIALAIAVAGCTQQPTGVRRPPRPWARRI